MLSFLFLAVTQKPNRLALSAVHAAIGAQAFLSITAPLACTRETAFSMLALGSVCGLTIRGGRNCLAPCGAAVHPG